MVASAADSARPVFRLAFLFARLRLPAVLACLRALCVRICALAAIALAGLTFALPAAQAQDATYTVMSVDPDPFASGAHVSFTATVREVSDDSFASGPVCIHLQRISGTYPTGGPVCGTAPSSGGNIGTYEFNFSGIPTGTYKIWAEFDGSSAYSPSTSPVLIRSTSSSAVTTTTLALSSNPIIETQSVTFTATVSSAGGPTPTGDVEFSTDNGISWSAPATLSGGQAIYVHSSLTSGSYQVRARYAGSTSHNSSISSAETLQVDPVPTIAVGPALPAGQVGTAYSRTFSASGGTAPYGFAVTSPPPGLTLSGDTLSGTPTAAGTFNFTVTATDADGFTGDRNYSVSVSQAASTTVLNSSSPTSTYGDSVTFTATVTSTAGTPTGTVTFTVDGTTYSSAALAGGVASFTTSAIEGGSHTIAATYSGDGNYTGSSDTLTQTVGKLATTAALVSTVTPSTYGDNVTFTVTVAPVSGAAIPAGTVIFSIDGAAEPAVALGASGQASFSTTALTSGLHIITADYSGSVNYIASTGTLAQQVDQAAAAVALASTPNPSEYGNSVTFTATVTPTSGVGTPTGTVTFAIDGTPQPAVTLTGGVAALTTSTLGIGSHAIEAAYSGDTNFTAATNTLNQDVDVISTTTTLVSSANPSTVAESIDITATVTPASGGAVPTGNVSIFINGALSAVMPLNASGELPFSVAASQAGVYTFEVVYAGSATHAGSSGTLSQIVNLNPTTTALVSSANPSNAGDAVTFTATVTPTSSASTPGGSVTFSVDGAAVSTVPLAGGEAVFATSTLGAGAHMIEAAYSGDTVHAASTDTLNQVVGVISTTTTLASSANPGIAGDSVTFTATVSPDSGATTPTGTVTFSIDGTAVSTAALTGGEATFATSTLGAGTHTIEAAYSGDTAHAASTDTLSQIVGVISTTTTLASSTNPGIAGENVTFTATVAQSSGGSIPTGSVTFSVDGTAASSVALAGGEATFATSALAVGSHTIVAVYVPDPAFGTSSASLVQDIGAVGTTTTVTSSRNPAVAFEEVTFTATVEQQSGSTLPVGSVRFAIDGADVATVGLADGSAAFSTSSLTPGDHTVEAIYEPDPPFAASSAQLVQSVTRIVTTTSLSSSANPGIAGQNITFSATVNPTATTAGGSGASTEVTGTLTFSFDGVDQPPVTLAGGVATIATADLAAGSHSIVATYSGDASHGASVSPALEQVIDDVDGTITIRQTASGRDATFAFSSPRPELNLSITTISGEGDSGPVRLARGSYVITADDMTGAGFGLNDISCDDDDSTGDLMSRSASIELDAGETVTCTFASVHADVATSMIEGFMATRGRMVLLAQPDIGRRMDRLKGAASGGGNPASTLMSYMPVLASGGPIEISTSLNSLSRMADPQAEPDRFDLWLSGSHYRIDGSGSYTAGAVGADYLATTKLLVGGFVMIDHLDISPSPMTSVEGTGWLAGGYLTARLSENLFLDVLGAGGASDNTITPLGTYTDDFTTTRFLASATLQGDWRYGAWTLSPRAALAWYREDSGAYVDSLGVTIPSARSATGEFALGPGLAYVHDAGSGWTVSPGLRLDGVLRYTDTPGGSEADFLGRLEARLDVTAPGGATVGLVATADGIGSSDPLAYGGRLRIAIPLN